MKPIDVACPYCGAQPGQRCKTVTGYAIWKRSHRARQLAATGDSK